MGQQTTHCYYELFAISPAGKYSGDITPGYSTLDSRDVAFARKVLPNHCKLFIILRNPIERIWSAINCIEVDFIDDFEAANKFF